MNLHEMFFVHLTFIHGTTWSPHALRIVVRASIREGLVCFQTVLVGGGGIIQEGLLHTYTIDDDNYI